MGILVSIGLTFGFLAHFSTEQWGLVFWGEHAALRVLASAIAAAAGGCVAGLFVGRHGTGVGAASVLPALLLWVFVAVAAWTGNWSFFSSPLILPKGGVWVATGIPLLLLPVGMIAGNAGAEYRRRHEVYFAVRPGLFGIRLKHYFWIPAYAILILTQAAWAAIFGWRVLEVSADGDLVRFPLLLLVGLGFVLLWRGARGIYLTLAESNPTGGAAVKIGRILKFGIVYPAGAWVAHASALMLLVISSSSG